MRVFLDPGGISGTQRGICHTHETISGNNEVLSGTHEGICGTQVGISETHWGSFLRESQNDLSETHVSLQVFLIPMWVCRCERLRKILVRLSQRTTHMGM